MRRFVFSPAVAAAVVLAASASSAAAAASQPGGDPDGDGIPTVIDADADGNGTVDAVDGSYSNSKGAGLFSDLQVDLQHSLNANATGASRAAIDAFVKEQMSLAFF